MSLLSLGFPYYSGFLTGSAQAQGAAGATPGEQTCTMKVEGMTCGGCEVHVTSVLEELPGVSDASADAVAGTATVVYDSQADVASFPTTVGTKTPYTATACQVAAHAPKG